MTLDLGRPAPDVTVYRGDETVVALHTYWHKRPLVLTFLRHYGCQFCREWLTHLRHAYPEFVARGAAVIAIAQGSGPQAAHFANMLRIPFPVLADPKRQAFRAYGLVDEIQTPALTPRVMAHMVGAAARGYLPGIGAHLHALTESDGTSLKQVGGTFVVGRDGVLAYAHIATPIYRHPALAEVLAALPSERPPTVHA